MQILSNKLPKIKQNMLFWFPNGTKLWKLVQKWSSFCSLKMPQLTLKLAYRPKQNSTVKSSSTFVMLCFVFIYFFGCGHRYGATLPTPALRVLACVKSLILTNSCFQFRNLELHRKCSLRRVWSGQESHQNTGKLFFFFLKNFFFFKFSRS